MPSFTKLDYVGVPSSDTDRSIKFYGETLGLTPDAKTPSEFWIGETCISIWEPAKYGMPFAPQKSSIRIPTPRAPATTSSPDSLGGIPSVSGKSGGTTIAGSAGTDAGAREGSDPATGTVVGEPTAMWDVYTGGGTMVDGTTVRLPFMRNAQLDNAALERASRRVDIPLERPMGESYTGRDVQLERAVQELMTQVRSSRARAGSGQ